MGSMTPPDNDNGSGPFLDLIQPFLIDRSSIRGRMVRLGDVVDTILHRHNYPDAVSNLLGELLVITAMLGSKLKEDGILTIQLRGDGPVSLMVADCTAAGELRGYADFDADAMKALLKRKKPPAFGQLVGKGYFAITLDPGADMERYQGIVNLEGESFTDCVKTYFESSEQIDVALKVGVGRSERPEGGMGWVAGGIMAQRMPTEGGVPSSEIRIDMFEPERISEDWNRAIALLGTVRDFELLDPALDPQRLLYNLFHEDGVWAFESRPVQVGCRCSRERIENVIRSMSDDDIAHLVVDGTITVTCQFCNKDEVFRRGEFLAPNA